MTFRRGRPRKYGAYLRILDDNELYSPATIADAGKEHGLFPEGLSPAEEKVYRKRVRQAMSRLASYLPGRPDGTVKLRGQEPSRAWYGQHWKEQDVE